MMHGPINIRFNVYDEMIFKFSRKMKINFSSYEEYFEGTEEKNNKANN